MMDRGWKNYQIRLPSSTENTYSFEKYHNFQAKVSNLRTLQEQIWHYLVLVFIFFWGETEAKLKQTDKTYLPFN